LFAFVLGCGKDDAAIAPDAPDVMADASQTCQPQSAIGTFYRRPPNPRLVAGRTFTGGQRDTAITDPDLHWDGAAWHLYYQTPHSTSFGEAGPQIIRHATSSDLATWSFDEAPSLTIAGAGAWDATHTETPTVVENPDAPADRRYLMLYSGASTTLPGHPFPAYAIGAAFSADGTTFTRVPAAQSPHGKDGLVLTGADAYPGAGGAIVADPEVVLVGGTYHLWFSSFACSGANCATVDASGVGHATSTDGVHWTVGAAPIPSLLRASADKRSGGAQPSVIYDDVHCKWEMWLTSDSPATENDDQPIELDNMVGVWHATSTNGQTWNINYNFARDLVWDQTAAGERLGLMTGADVARKGTGRYMVYVGFDDDNVPSGSQLPDRTQSGFRDGVMTLNLATRDAP
jgi:hypothetical protein